MICTLPTCLNLRNGLLPNRAVSWHMVHNLFRMFHAGAVVDRSSAGLCSPSCRLCKNSDVSYVG